MKLRPVLLGSFALVTFLGSAPAPLDAAPLLLQSRWDEAAVIRSFRAVVGRNPHPYELRRYAVLMDDYGWTEEDVRRDLAERTDYRRYSKSQALMDVDDIIRRAYLDILGREPDPAGIRSYRQHIVQEGWSEREVREALRRSPEYNSPDRRLASADRIIRRAYQDILRREPDPEGLQTYRRAIVEDGWDEYDVRRALRRSDERREIRSGRDLRTQDTASEIVRRAYLNVLRREPDEAGLRDYGNRVARDNWTQADVERALRDSDEYRQKFR
jgi:hypothetical protein